MDYISDFVKVILTNYINDLVVNIEGDEWNGQQTEVKFEKTGDGVDVIISVLCDVGHLSLCDIISKNIFLTHSNKLQIFNLILFSKAGYLHRVMQAYLTNLCQKTF